MTSVTSTSATVSAAPARQPERPRAAVGDRLGQPGGAEGRRQEAGQRDADLHGGEEAVGVADELGDPRRPAGPLLGQRLGLRLAQADQRDLGGGEDAADEDEDSTTRTRSSTDALTACTCPVTSRARRSTGRFHGDTA